MYFNSYGFLTLLKKEILRYFKVANQTVIAPVITALLFLAIFSLAFAGRVTKIGSIDFQLFMIPGLIAMVMIQNAFANSSSSLCTSKILGHVIDVLIPPISAIEYILAAMIAAATRGIIVAVLTALAIRLFIDYQIENLLCFFYYLLLSSLIMGLLGIICGILANSFDQMSAFTSYVITPLSFLSGTFYSINNLPDFWLRVSSFNPFFYMIDGIRYAVTGYHDGNLLLGNLYLLICLVTLFVLSSILYYKGYRIKN